MEDKRISEIFLQALKYGTLNTWQISKCVEEIKQHPDLCLQITRGVRFKNLSNSDRYEILDTILKDKNTLNKLVSSSSILRMEFREICYLVNNIDNVRLKRLCNYLLTRSDTKKTLQLLCNDSYIQQEKREFMLSFWTMSTLTI